MQEHGDKIISAYEILTDTFAPLKPLLDDSDIQEIMINRFDNIYIEKFGKTTKTEIEISPEMMDASMRLLARAVNEKLDEDNPILEARFEDGSRVAGAIPPIVEHSYLSIRKFSIIDVLLNDYGFEPKIVNFLINLINSKKNFLIAGGTSTGKTTFFNALLKELKHDIRVIIIEDTRELKLPAHIDNAVQLEAKKKKVSQRALVKLSLRSRPDKLILGEVRDEAAYDLCSALNSGHSGGSTIHANNARLALSKLEMYVLQAGTGWDVKSIRAFIATSIEVVVFLENAKGKRLVSEIKEVRGYDDNGYILKTIYSRIEEEELSNMFNGII